jgi:hypothetical protein
MGGAGAVDDLLEVLVQHAGILAAQHVVRPEHENGDMGGEAATRPGAGRRSVCFRAST